ncbi:MAG: helix-turn-helix domain-containing protein [Methyloceanibacter sp.]|jgi:DNA invertase Pin-like site-specific DNA recombinase
MAYSFNVVASIGQWEREIMLERQREGIARAKKLGRYKGRAPTARNKAREIIALTNQGVKPLEIGRRLAVSRASVYRILADNGAAPQQT